MGKEDTHVFYLAQRSVGVEASAKAQVRPSRTHRLEATNFWRIESATLAHLMTQSPFDARGDVGVRGVGVVAAPRNLGKRAGGRRYVVPTSLPHLPEEMLSHAEPRGVQEVLVLLF